MNAKKILKKFTAIVCCAGCLFSWSTDVYGKETTEIEVTQEMKNGVTAYMETENGEIQPLDCDISLVKHTSNARVAGDMYTLEVKASNQKASSDSIAQANIGLLGRITWIDHLGTSNELVSYYGLYSNPSQIAHASYHVGRANKTEHVFTMDNITQKSSFYYEDPCHNKGSSFFIYMKARTNDGKQVKLRVSTSMSD